MAELCLRTRFFDPKTAFVDPLRAEGVCLAHTGTLVSFLFAGPEAGTKAQAGAEIALAFMPTNVKLDIVQLVP